MIKFMEQISEASPDIKQNENCHKAVLTKRTRLLETIAKKMSIKQRSQKRQTQPNEKVFKTEISEALQKTQNIQSVFDKSWCTICFTDSVLFTSLSLTFLPCAFF